MNADNRLRLELFVEKATLLQSGNFYKHLAEQGLSLNLKFQEGSGLEVTHNAPEGEPLHALAITFRMFIQNNDRISFGRMTELLGDAGISQNWKDQFSDVRDQLNTFLDGYGDIQLQLNGAAATLRETMDVFMYGELAHTSATKRALYQEWKSNPIIFQFVRNRFTTAVMETLSAIGYVSEISRLELLGETVPPLAPKVITTS